MWSCFPSQHNLLNKNTSTLSQPKSDQYCLAEPTEIETSLPQWIQKPAAAKVSSVQWNTAMPQVPEHELNPAFISLILDARVGEQAIGYDEVRSRPHDKCLVAQIYLQGRTISRKLTYSEALSIPGGYDALRVYFVPSASYNPTPPLPREDLHIPPSLLSHLKSMWLSWRERYGRRKSQLPETTLWPTYQSAGPG
ncbi:hypothetical protein BJX70DRAFT_374678 [Aspergillus crustosus]